jgi:hypothetical protein
VLPTSINADITTMINDLFIFFGLPWKIPPTEHGGRLGYSLSIKGRHHKIP